MAEQVIEKSPAMQKNYKADIERLSEIAERISDNVLAGASQIREVQVATAGLDVGSPIVGDSTSAPQSAPSNESIAVEGDAPKEKPISKIHAYVKHERERELSEREIIEKVRPFLDPELRRPIYISTPIDGKVFIGVYPSFGEILAAERIIGAPPIGANEDSVAEYSCLAEITAVIKGYLPEVDSGIMTILEYPGDPSKWPALKRMSFINSMLPRVRNEIFPLLFRDYTIWKLRVTPSDAELEKYSGLK